MNAYLINTKNKATIDDAKIKTKTPKDNNFKYNVGRKSTRRIDLLIQVLALDHLIIKTAK